MLVIESDWELENTSRERLPLQPSPPEPQHIPIPMSDGYYDQPSQDERQRERSRSCERVNAGAQGPQIPQIQPMPTPELVAVSDEDFTVMNPCTASSSRTRSKFSKTSSR